MGKKYTIILEESRGRFSTPGKDFKIIGLENTIEFTVGHYLTQSSVNRIIGDSNSVIKVKARKARKE